MQAKSKYKWTSFDHGWRLEDRHTGKILGYCQRAELSGSYCWEALVIGLSPNLSAHQRVSGDGIPAATVTIGYFSHWSKAKRAVIAEMDERETYVGRKFNEMLQLADAQLSFLNPGERL